MKSPKLVKTLLSLCLSLGLLMALAVPAFAIRADVKSFVTDPTGTNLYAGGSGTAKDPYHIQTVEQFSNIRRNLGAKFVLDNDLDFSGVKEWDPIGYYLPEDLSDLESGGQRGGFSGRLDGQGYTIKNFQPAFATATRLGIGLDGLFASLTGKGKILNLSLKGFDVKGLGMMVGGLVGYMGGQSVLKNVHMVGKNKVLGFTNVGGLVGGVNSSRYLKNCSATCDITLTGTTTSLKSVMAAGVLCGGGEGTSFENCKVSNSSVNAIGTGVDSIGSVSGCAFDAKYFKNCSAENVTINVKDASLVGGLVGMAGNMEGCDKNAARTQITGCSVKNVTINCEDGAERIGMILGGGYFRQAWRTGEEAYPEPGAFVIRNCTANGAVNGGKWVGAVAGFQSRNSVAKNNKTSVKWNGKALTKVYGASISNVSLDDLN